MRNRTDPRNYNSNPVPSSEHSNVDFASSYRSPIDQTKKQASQLVLKILPRDTSPARYTVHHSARPSISHSNQDHLTPSQRSKSPNGTSRSSTNGIRTRINLLRKIEDKSPEEVKKVLNVNFPPEGETYPIILPTRSNLMKRPGPYFLAQKMEEAKKAKNSIVRINATRVQHHERGISQTISKTTTTEESVHEPPPYPPYNHSSMQKLLKKFPPEPRTPYTEPLKKSESPDNKLRTRIKQQIIAEISQRRRLNEHTTPSPTHKTTELATDRSGESPPIRTYMFQKAHPRSLTSRKDRGTKSFTRHNPFDGPSQDTQSRIHTLQDDSSSHTYFSKIVNDMHMGGQTKTPLFKNQVLAKAIIEFRPSEDRTFKSPRLTREIYTRNSFMRSHLKVDGNKHPKHIRAESNDQYMLNGDLDDLSDEK